MQAMNEALEGADAFAKMLQKCTNSEKPQARGPESRHQRRERERLEKKAEKRAIRAVAA